MRCRVEHEYMINVEHVYQMNIIAPYRQEKSTLIEGKYKDPQSPYKNHKVRWRTRYGNMRWITTKQTRGLIFNMQNSLLLTCSWPTEEIFQYTAKIGSWKIFQLSIFVLSHEKCQYRSHWIRNFRFSFSYFGFLPLRGKFERLRP